MSPRFPCGCSAQPVSSADYCLIHRRYYCHAAPAMLTRLPADRRPVPCPACRAAEAAATAPFAA